MRLPSSEHKPTTQNDKKKTARRYRLAVLNPLEQKGLKRKPRRPVKRP